VFIQRRTRLKHSERSLKVIANSTLINHLFEFILPFPRALSLLRKRLKYSLELL
jgi:hypothetical protein